MAINYTPIAPQFDRRYQANRLDGVAAALRNRIGSDRPASILEVGCGTGRWLAEFLGRPGRVYGLDPSAGMLAQAQSKSQQFRLIAGKAEKLPFQPNQFDLVFVVNALHQFAAPDHFIAEVQRVLKPAGMVALIGQTPHDPANRWYVYDYFDGAYQADLARFPTWGQVLDWLVCAGFSTVHWQPVEQIDDQKIGRAVFDDPFLAKDAVSQLAIMTDQQYQAGLQKIEKEIRAGEIRGHSICFSTYLRLDLLIGQKSD